MTETWHENINTGSNKTKKVRDAAVTIKKQTKSQKPNLKLENKEKTKTPCYNFKKLSNLFSIPEYSEESNPKSKMTLKKASINIPPQSQIKTVTSISVLNQGKQSSSSSHKQFMPPLKCYARPSPNLNNQDKTENNCNQDCEVPLPVNCGDQNPPPDIDQNSTPVNLVPAVTVRSGQVVQVDHHVKLHPDD